MSLRRSALALTLLAGCAVVGCAAVGGAQTPDRDAWTEARDRWEESQPERYSYRVGLSCECTGVLNYYVSVDGGRINSTAALDYDGQPLAPGDVFEGETVSATPDAPTLDELFDLLDQAIRDGYAIQASYDATYGFPTSAQPDVIAAATDGSVGYFVSDFEAQ